MNNNNSIVNDLNDFKNYLKNKFDINVSIRYPIEKKTNITIQNIYLKLLIQIIILILCIYLFLKNKKYKIFVNIILFFIILYILYNIFCYFYKIYLYNHIYKNNIDNIDNYISYKNINFSTGDIIQENLPWYNTYGIFSNIINNITRYFHGGMIIRFKNKNYLLHLYGGKCKYSNPILYFNNNNNIEICPLNDYIKDNYYCNINYRLFKINHNKKIDNDNLFNILKEFDIKKILFKFYIHFPKNNNYNDNFSKNYNCLNFIFKILYKLNIIPLFNFQNILNDDLLFLPNLSNNIYNKEIIIKAK